VPAALEAVSLEAMALRPEDRYGSARELAGDIERWLADEPVSSLDASVRGEILALLLRLRQELGLTILVVTHDLGLAWNIADRLAVMYLGRVVEIAKTARKRAIGLACVSQDLSDLLRYPEAVSIVTNAAMQILFRQSPQAIDGLVKAFGLTEGERSFLLSCAIGEGILVAGGHRVGFRAIASPEEERLLQTGLSGGCARLS